MSEYNRTYTRDDVIIQYNPYMIIQTKFMYYDLPEIELDSIVEIIQNNYSSTGTKRIYFNQFSEGLQLGILKPIDYIVRKLESFGVPRNKFVFLSGAAECPENRKFYADHCRNLGLLELEMKFDNSFQNRMLVNIELENLHGNHHRPVGPKKKKFLCFNRNVKYHRLFVTAETIRRGLLDKSYFSMYVNGTEQDGMGQIRSRLEHFQNWENYLPNVAQSAIQVLNDNQHLFPLRLSLHNNLELPHGIRNDLNLFDDSYFGVVTESKFFADTGNIHEMKNQLTLDCFFFTEKTYKFIAAKMPFVFVGFKNSLKILKHLGYKTFHPYINESYDSIENDEERLLAIMDEIERLSNLSDEQWNELEKDLLPIVNHNYGVLTKKMKKVSMIGMGKLGQDCAEVMSGHYDVVGYDIVDRDTTVIMTPTLADAVKHKDIIFIAAPTPHDPIYGGETPSSHLPNKDFDYSIVTNILNEVNQHVSKDQLVVLISTVLPGTIRSKLAPCITNARFIYNPYLIAMGTVKWDMVNPEMIIIGTEDGSTTGDAKELIDFYAPMMQNNPRYEVGTWDEAEAIKIFYNTFISTKLALVNMIQDVAETNGNMNVDVVTNALAKSTHRIMGPAYMKAGLGDAGACHPRDNIALRYLADRLDLGYDLFDSIMTTREVQAERMALRCLKNGKNITIIGKAYKPNVPYTNGSASMLVGHYIEKHGGFVNYYDEHTGDLDLKEDWTDVYLIGYWDEYTKHLRCFTNEQQSVVIDPWRQFKDHYKDCSEVIYYGDTRPTTTYSTTTYSIENISNRFYSMFPELEQYKHAIHMIDANVTPDTTFLRRTTEEIVKEIREAHSRGKTKFIFNSMYEGLMPSVINKIHRISRIVSDIIPAHDLFCFSGAIDASFVYDRLYSHKVQNRITIVGTNYYLHSTQLDTEPFEFIGEYVKMHKENVFLCLNRMNRDHRVKLLDKMLEYGHANRGFYSFESQGDHGWIDSRPELQQVYPNINRHKEKLPLRVNINSQRTQYSNTIHEDLYFYQHSLFSIVNETLFYDENHQHSFHKPMGIGSLCISEKTYRCFALQHPFIVLGRPGILAELRRQGFKTFSPWIDESYDLISNDEERFNAIFKEICRLMAHSHNADWTDIQQQWKHVIEYNKVHFHTVKSYTIDNNIVRHFSDVIAPPQVVEPEPITDEVITMPITGDGDPEIRTVNLTSGLKFTYPLLLDGGGLGMKDALVETIRRTGKERYQRAFEWCAGFGAMGFEVLGSQLADHMVFSDYFHVALDTCKQISEDNNLSHQITCHLSSMIKNIPSVEKWDLVISNPPHYNDRDGFVEYMAMHNKLATINNDARIIVDQDWTIHREFFRNIRSHLTDDADLYIIEAQQIPEFIEWAVEGGLKHIDTYYIEVLPRGGIYHFKVNI